MTLEEELQIKALCRELIIQAASHADQHQARALADVFTADGCLRRPGGEPILGREAIFQTYAARPADRMTRHLITNTLVELRSSTEALATSYALVLAGSRNEEDSAKGRKASSCQVGEFEDRLVLTGEGWRIAERRASFTLYVP